MVKLPPAGADAAGEPKINLVEQLIRFVVDLDGTREATVGVALAPHSSSPPESGP
jgi:hypothetical protein